MLETSLVFTLELFVIKKKVDVIKILKEKINRVNKIINFNPVSYHIYIDVYYPYYM